jgi:hypothetical protein
MAAGYSDAVPTNEEPVSENHESQVPKEGRLVVLVLVFATE